MGERRSAGRERALKAGRIKFGPGDGVRCMIRNLSSSGALLELGGPTDLPDKFVLVVLSNLKQRSCEVVWRQRSRFGVAFTGPEFFNSTTTDAARRTLVRAALAASVAR
jgi:hypothetical protein